MGMFDNVKCEYPLPDSSDKLLGETFQTKSFGDGFTGGFMDNYTITADGKLILHKVVWDYVEEEDRPYYGTSDWEEHPILRMVGSLKTIPVGDEEINHHGIINIYNEIEGTWFEFEIKFTDGEVAGIKRIYREFGNE